MPRHGREGTRVSMVLQGSSSTATPPWLKGNLARWPCTSTGTHAGTARVSHLHSHCPHIRFLVPLLTLVPNRNCFLLTPSSNLQRFLPSSTHACTRTCPRRRSNTQVASHVPSMGASGTGMAGPAAAWPRSWQEAAARASRQRGTSGTVARASGDAGAVECWLPGGLSHGAEDAGESTGAEPGWAESSSESMQSPTGLFGSKT